jgi:hypothetical protein
MTANILIADNLFLSFPVGSVLFKLRLTAERLCCIGGAKADGDWTEKRPPKYFPSGYSVEDLEFTSFLKAYHHEPYHFWEGNRVSLNLVSAAHS